MEDLPIFHLVNPLHISANIKVVKKEDGVVELLLDFPLINNYSVERLGIGMFTGRSNNTLYGSSVYEGSAEAGAEYPYSLDNYSSAINCSIEEANGRQVTIRLGQKKGGFNYNVGDKVYISLCEANIMRIVDLFRPSWWYGFYRRHLRFRFKRCYIMSYFNVSGRASGSIQIAHDGIWLSSNNVYSKGSTITKGETFLALTPRRYNSIIEENDPSVDRFNEEQYSLLRVKTPKTIAGTANPNEAVTVQ